MNDNVKSTHKWLLAFAALGLLTVGGVGLHLARANGIPSTKALTYVGTLEDAGGKLVEGPHDIGLVVWDSGVQGDGTKWCEVAPQSLIVKNGRFELSLPDSCPAGFKDRADTFLEISVDGENMGRSRVGAVPYAVEADTASSARRATNADHADQADAATGAKEVIAGGGLDQALASGSAATQQVNARVDNAGIIEAWKECTVRGMLTPGNASPPRGSFSSHDHPAKCRRVGDSLEVMGSFYSTPGASELRVSCSELYPNPGPGELNSFPSYSIAIVGFDVDDDKLRRDGPGAMVGSIRIETTGAFSDLPLFRAALTEPGQSAEQNRLILQGATAGVAGICARAFTNAPYVGFVSHPTLAYHFTIPIKGWGATVAP
jgi:hypothetical protein